MEGSEKSGGDVRQSSALVFFTVSHMTYELHQSPMLVPYVTPSIMWALRALSTVVTGGSLWRCCSDNQCPLPACPDNAPYTSTSMIQLMYWMVIRGEWAPYIVKWTHAGSSCGAICTSSSKSIIRYHHISVATLHSEITTVIPSLQNNALNLQLINLPGTRCYVADWKEKSYGIHKNSEKEYKAHRCWSRHPESVSIFKDTKTKQGQRSYEVINFKRETM